VIRIPCVNTIFLRPETIAVANATISDGKGRINLLRESNHSPPSRCQRNQDSKRKNVRGVQRRIKILCFPFPKATTKQTPSREGRTVMMLFVTQFLVPDDERELLPSSPTPLTRGTFDFVTWSGACPIPTREPWIANQARNKNKRSLPNPLRTKSDRGAGVSSCGSSKMKT